MNPSILSNLCYFLLCLYLLFIFSHTVSEGGGGGQGGGGVGYEKEGADSLAECVVTEQEGMVLSKRRGGLDWIEEIGFLQ